MDSSPTYDGLPPVASSSSSSSSAALFANNLKGLLLAVASSAFIGASFIFKKKGLKRAGASGARAGVGGYGYLLEPLWWIGMITMIVGEISNFVAYMFAPAVLVTPLGALSIIVSAVLAHFFLKEKLQRMGVLGCVLCIVGSTVIVLHAPEEKTPSSVEQIWNLATQPAFLFYAASAVAVSLVLMLHCSPRYGQTNIMVYLGICSAIGSLTVMSIKAIGIAIKLTVEGINQAGYFQTWVFAMVAITCIIIQLIYLNKGKAMLVLETWTHLWLFLTGGCDNSTMKWKKLYLLSGAMESNASIRPGQALPDARPHRGGGGVALGGRP
ncbi:probable magnesium transporter NIPA6 isoform X5 [Elaeis guineensis]|uniref:probable magnesium transporter NIPA6 isoform X5 n=1 Tax=Elaeis guineensis var. tenera TaxID=51953 RepID=UPI003C6D7003